MTPDDAAGPGTSTAQTNDDNDDCMAKDLVAKSIRAAMAKAAQILDGDTARVSFGLRYRVQRSVLHFGRD